MHRQPESVAALLDRLAEHDIIALVSRSQATGPATAGGGEEFMTTDELARLLRGRPVKRAPVAHGNTDAGTAVRAAV